MIFDAARQAELKKFTFAVYILQALYFVLVITPIIGLLESHFRWQQATFWYGLLWTVLGLVTLPLLVGYLVLPVVMVWLIYRIARGWINLVDGKEMYPIAMRESE